VPQHQGEIKLHVENTDLLPSGGFRPLYCQLCRP